MVIKTAFSKFVKVEITEELLRKERKRIAIQNLNKTNEGRKFNLTLNKTREGTYTNLNLNKTSEGTYTNLNLNKTNEKMKTKLNLKKTTDETKINMYKTDEEEKLNDQPLLPNVHKPKPKKKDEGMTKMAMPYIYGILLYTMILMFLCSTLYMGYKICRTKPRGTSVLVYDGVHKFVTWPDPPPRDNYAAVARYVMHISEWGSLATNSTHKGIEGYPFVNIFSVSDGPFKNSTGVPYFYLTPMELSVIDIEATNKVSLTVTEAQSNYCNKHGFDPEDPRCAHIILTGTIKKIEKDSEEEKFAKNALFSRHVEMQNWPSGHEWFFAKLDIIHIYLLDYFGGVATVKPEDYFVTNPFDKD